MAYKGKKAPKGGKGPLPLPLFLLLVFLALVWYGYQYFYAEDREEKDTTGSGLQVTFIDVGQADSILLSFPEGDFALVDAGNNDDAAVIEETLQKAGVEKLAFAVGTHPHEDHIGSLDAVLLAFPTEVCYMPDYGATSATYNSVLDALEETGTEARIPANGETIYNKGDCRVEVVWNGDDAPDANNASIVLKVEYGEDSLLLTGDAETVTEEKILESGAEISANLLKVGHHGSSTSTSQEFLEAVNPDYGVISCGEGNSYGHPHAETVKRLEKAGVELYRTDLLGTLVFSTRGKGWTTP